MKRAFISAPLLGTIIFLAAVLFVSHITQTEKIGVANTISETYHNTIVNTLQNYRADVGSLFAVSVGKAIEKYLTRQCWQIFKLQNSDESAGRELLKGAVPLGFKKQEFSPGAGNPDVFDFDEITDKKNGGQPIFPAAMRNDNSPTANPLAREQGNGQLDYHELRYKQCAKVGDVIRQAICPLDTKYGVPAWLSATRRKSNFQGIEFTVANNDLVKEFEDNFYCQFEEGGRKFTITNDNYFKANPNACIGRSIGEAGTIPGYECRCIASGENKNCAATVGLSGEGKIDSSDAALAGLEGMPCAGKAGKIYYGAGRQRCEALIGDTQFDCRNFAENLADPLRCCSLYADASKLQGNDKQYAGQCCTADLVNSKLNVASKSAGVCNYAGGPAKNYVVPGCESGSFFIPLNVLASEEVYKSLPRIKAQDKSGNTLQSGALGTENFLVHIKYPLFKYYDAAFKIYAATAYGVQGKAFDFLDPTANMKKFEGQCKNIPSDAIDTGVGGSGGTAISAASTRNNQEKKTEHDKVNAECSNQPNTGRLPQDNSEGVIEGWALGPAVSFKIDSSTLSDSKRSYERRIPFHLGTNRPGAQKEANEKFYENFFDPAKSTGICRLFRETGVNGVCDINPSPFHDEGNLCKMQMWLKGPGLYDNADNDGFYELCGYSPAASGYRASPRESEVRSKLKVARVQECAAGNAQFCAYVQQLGLEVKLVDYDPAFVTSSADVKPDDPTAATTFSNNTFCWQLYPFHDNPRLTP